MCKLNPSVISVKPIIIKKAKARIFSDGCLLIKLLMFFEMASIIEIDTITATYIIQSLFTKPTAVIILSTEKTKSNNKTCPIVFLKEVLFLNSL